MPKSYEAVMMYMKNRQIQKDTEISTVNKWVKTQFKSHAGPKYTTGFRYYTT